MDVAAVWGGVAGLLTGGLGGWLASIYKIRTDASHNAEILKLERDKLAHERDKWNRERLSTFSARHADALSKVRELLNTAQQIRLNLSMYAPVSDDIRDEALDLQSRTLLIQNELYMYDEHKIGHHLREVLHALATMIIKEDDASAVEESAVEFERHILTGYRELGQSEQRNESKSNVDEGTPKLTVGSNADDEHTPS